MVSKMKNKTFRITRPRETICILLSVLLLIASFPALRLPASGEGSSAPPSDVVTMYTVAVSPSY